MKVYLNAEGAILQVTPSVIPRGSTVADFEVEGPFAAVAISVRFTLRKGTTDPLLLTRVSSVSAPGLNVWSAKIPFAVTEYAGTVPYEIEVQDGEGYIIKSIRGTLTITPGAVPTLPPAPDANAWTQMIGYLNQIYDAIANGADTSELERAISVLQNWVTDFEERRSITVIDGDTTTVYELIEASLAGKLEELITTRGISVNSSTYRLIEQLTAGILELWASLIVNDDLLSGKSLQNEEILAINGGKHIRFTTDEEMTPILDMLQAYINGEIKGGSSIWIGPTPPPDNSYDVWIDTSDNSNGAPVQSVNGKIGKVELTPADVGADPAGSAAAVQTNLNTHAGNKTNPHGVSKSQIGLGNVANERQYSASNPPPYPVTSVNGKTGAAQLTAADVGARPSTWMPTASEVGADPYGAAVTATTAHNTATTAHNDIRLLIEGLTNRLNALADSDDTTLDQLSELVDYIKDNRELIESVTTSKVNVADIINNLTSNVSTKPLSAAQGVALKALIDAITVPTKLSELSGDSTHRTVTDAEKSAWNAKSDFSGKYTDLDDKPDLSGYLTSESDPTVPAWAKNSTKPNYTASEVGADPAGSAAAVQGNLDTHAGNKSNPHGVSKSQVGLGNVANERQYSASNPPPYPVTSVNGKTGAVVFTTETWTFELEDGKTVTKVVLLG